MREKVEYYRKKDAPREDPVKDPRRRGNSDDTDVRRHKDQNSKFKLRRRYLSYQFRGI